MTQQQRNKILIKIIKLNIMQVDLARIIGCSRQMLNQVINGRAVSLKIEEALEDFIEMPFEDFTEKYSHNDDTRTEIN